MSLSSKHHWIACSGWIRDCSAQRVRANQREGSRYIENFESDQESKR